MVPLTEVRSIPSREEPEIGKVISNSSCLSSTGDGLEPLELEPPPHPIKVMHKHAKPRQLNALETLAIETYMSLPLIRKIQY